MMRLRLKPTDNPKTHEKLERLKRWPSIRSKWLSKTVYIWSAEHLAYWRDNCCGYTSDIKQAGVYTFPDAWKNTKHCCPMKCIEYKEVYND